MAMGMKSLIFAMVFLIAVAEPASASGDHCWYSGTIHQPAADLNFGDNYKMITGRTVGGAARETYVVPEGAKLIVQKIDNAFVASCVDGVSGTYLPSVRLLEEKEDGTMAETSGNYSYGGEACSGGNTVVANSPEFLAFTFATNGDHSFELQYKQSIASAINDWKTIKRFDVLVAPGKLEVKPFKKPLVGFNYNAHGQDDSLEREIMWEVRNVGKIDVNITGLRAAACAGNISNCIFPNFRPEKGILLTAGATAYLPEKFSAQRPAISPLKEAMAMDISFTDIYGFISTNLTTGKAAIEQDLRFSVANSGLVPYTAPAKEFEVDYNRTYYVQTCTDSLGSSLHEPLFGVTVTKEDGSPVVGTNFHRIDSCSDASATGIYSLHNNNTFSDNMGGGGLKKFDTNAIFPEFTGKKKMFYRLGGTVGVQGQYRSDFLKIGTSFNTQTQLVEGIIVNDSLGMQEVRYSAPTQFTEAKLNAFLGTQRLGKYSPPSPDPTAGILKYVLYDVYLNGIKANAAPTLKLETPDNTVLINSDGEVFGRTIAVGQQSFPPPSSDVNLAWSDMEKYMFEAKGLEAGVCRTLQGGTMQLDGMDSRTGEGSRVRLKYDWRPDLVTENFCDPSNHNYVYCDATQFSIVLVRKLKGLDQKADAGRCGDARNGAEFYAYLMRDAFSADFQRDFDYYMRNEFASDPIKYFSDPQKDWGKYFSDTQRLTFVNADIMKPKLYRVNVDISFDRDVAAGQCPFFTGENGNPKAKVSVTFTEADSVAQKNLLYFLPIDGIVGMHPSGTPPTVSGMHRQGYGTGFRGSIASVFQTPDTRYSVTTIGMTQGSTPLATVDVIETTDFAQANKDDPGQVMRIVKTGDNAYSMKFTPTVPVPIVLLAEGKESPEKKNISVAYQLFQGTDQPVVASSELARLVEIGFQKGGKIECLDPTGVSQSGTVANAPASGLSLPSLAPNGNFDPAARSPIKSGFDKQLSAFATTNLCTLSQSVSNRENTYFFSREGVGDANIILESVLYAPSKARVDILNACASQGRLYVSGTANAAGFSELKPGSPSFTINSGAGSFGTIAEALEAIPKGDACIVHTTEQAGLERLPKSVGIWWNEGRIASAFGAMVQQKFAPAKFCQ